VNLSLDRARLKDIVFRAVTTRDPQWFKTLQANPEATIQVAAYKGYDSYQRKTSRDSPVVILTPA
jgi:hypothetical protein